MDRRKFLGAVAATLVGGYAAAQEGELTCSAIVIPPSGFYTSNKTYNDVGLHPWAQTSPEQQGMKSSTLATGLKEFARDKRAAGMCVCRNAILVAETYPNGRNALMANNIHSAAKSVASALTGIAIRDGIIPSVN